MDDILQKRVVRAKDRLVFISDVHLGAHSHIKNQRLEEALIRLIDECDALDFGIVILGDLYDFWMEYKNERPLLATRLMDRFNQFHAHNPATLYIMGNHDCWMQDYHSKLGFDLEYEFRVLKTSESTIFVHHGDGLSNRKLNLKRSLLNRTLRQHKIIQLYQYILPPFIGLKTMEKFSHFNKVIDNNIPDTKKLDRWTQQLFDLSTIDAAISGHDHVKRKKTFGDNVYMNCGAFFENQTIGLYNRNHFQLVSLKEQTLHQTVSTYSDQ